MNTESEILVNTHNQRREAALSEVSWGWESSAKNLENDDEACLCGENGLVTNHFFTLIWKELFYFLSYLSSI